MNSIERVYVKIGARIRIARNRAGVTQVHLAKRVGMSRPALANIEVGRQRIMIHDVKRFARALGTKPHILMRGIW